MNWEKSEVMSEFLKIASDNDMVKEALPEKNPNQESEDAIKDKKPKSPEKSIIEEAHPKAVYIAESRGDGALVENLIEQQKKIIEMLNKMPTGSLVGRYASAVNDLVKLAEQCDNVGEHDIAGLLTGTAEVLLNQISPDPLE